MKNQYFGDIRDLFKFDLIENMLDEKALKRFAYITMLTPNDDTNEGSQRDFTKAKAGYRNQCLVRFLKSFHKTPKNEKDIRDIREYFKSIGMETSLYTEDNSYFNKKNRNIYFDNINKNILENSIIFLDPDKGLEIKKSTEEHVLYSEIKELYRRMKNSLLIIIQFKKPVDHKEYWIKDLYRRSFEIASTINDLPIFVSDYKIAFFMLSKDLSIKTLTSETILKYKNQYPELLIGNLLIK